MEHSQPTSSITAAALKVLTSEKRNLEENERVVDVKRRKIQSTNIGFPVSPQEFALNLDHIFEKILNSLIYPDLLRCRRQSHRWNFFATRLLQKRYFSLSFTDHKTRKGKTLEDLVSILQGAKDISSLPPFPCTHYRISRDFMVDIDAHSDTRIRFPFLQDTVLHNLISNPRVNIRQLSLDIAGESGIEETTIMEKLSQVLANQASNLQTLTITVPYKMSISWKIGGLTRSVRSALRATDPEFQEICSKYNPTNCLMWTKLEKIYMTAHSSKILEMIIQLSPNLKQVASYGKDCLYLVEPINRLYLLKSLFFMPYSLKHVGKFEKLADASLEGNLKLKEIIVCLRGMDSLIMDQNLYGFHGIQRISNVLSRILECSWDSLQSINWSGVTIAGLKWPKTLPKVCYLSLCNPVNLLGTNVFLPGFNFSATLPAIEFVGFYNIFSLVKFEDVINSMTFQPAKSVTRCSVNLDTKEKLTEEQFIRIQTLFPGAKISQF